MQRRNLGKGPFPLHSQLPFPSLVRAGTHTHINSKPHLLSLRSLGCTHVNVNNPTCPLAFVHLFHISKASTYNMSYTQTATAYYDDGSNVAQGNLGSPPPYYYNAPPKKRHRWDPRSWTRRTKIIALGGGAILLIIIIVAAAVGSRDNRYPAYDKINYRLQDTCEEKEATFPLLERSC